jgi:chromosome segregation ATPase
MSLKNLWRRKVETTEMTINQLSDELRKLDAQRQRPQNELAETTGRIRTLQAELDGARIRLKNATGQQLVDIKREISTLQSGIADLQREADLLETKVRRIDDEAAGCHARIRELELPEDEAELRKNRDAVWEALDAARIALANYCACDRKFKAKHGQEGTRRASVILEKLRDREHRLRALGWTQIDVVSAPVGAFSVVAMLPPTEKQ